LGNHVLDWRLNRFRLNGIDGAEGQAQQSIGGGILGKLSRELIGQFNGLTLYRDIADLDGIGADRARC
jgi:hypothetical protein